MSKYYCSLCNGKENDNRTPLTCNICGFSDHLSCHEKKCTDRECQCHQCHNYTNFRCNVCRQGLHYMGIDVLRLSNKRDSEYEWKPVGKGPDAMMGYIEKEKENL